MYGRLIGRSVGLIGRSVGLRRSTSHVTRESFLKSTVGGSRHAAVQKASSQRARIYAENARPSFISNELFGRFERGIWFPRFKWGRTIVSRLLWFDKYPAELYRIAGVNALLEIVNNPEATFTNGKLKSILTNRDGEEKESIITSAARDLHLVSQLASRKPADALILARVLTNRRQNFILKYISK